MRRAAAAAWALLVLGLAGCAHGDGGVPETLADGRTASEPRAPLEGLDAPAVAAAVVLVEAEDAAPGSAAASCLETRPEDVVPGTVLVHRIGAIGESVTFRADGGRALVACDGVLGAGGARWCGSAHGRLHGGRLRDPRLGLGCAGPDGEPLGFVWIEPLPAAAYVVVEHGRYAEAHPVAGGVAVRVATGDVQLEESRAAAAVAEHDREGRLLRRYRLEASVAG
jgi:hypothetical protein